MTKHMGTLDRVIRTLIAIALIALIVTSRVTETWAIVAGIVAAAFLITSAAGFCPGHWPFKVSTRR